MEFASSEVELLRSEQIFSGLRLGLDQIIGPLQRSPVTEGPRSASAALRCVLKLGLKKKNLATDEGQWRGPGTTPWEGLALWSPDF
jgi:hypothetical protein